MARESRQIPTGRNGAADRSAQRATNGLQSASVASDSHKVNGYTTSTGDAQLPPGPLYDNLQQSGVAAGSRVHPESRGSANRPKARESTFPRLARPDPFAPKRETITRNFVQPLITTRRPGESSDPPSPGPRRRAPADNVTERFPNSTVRRPTESQTPIWQRLSQHGTIASSAKGRGQIPGFNADLQASPRELLNGDLNTPRSSLLGPRIENVGEDFDLTMEGASGGDRGPVNGVSSIDRLRQDSGGDVEGAASADQNSHDATGPQLEGPANINTDARSEEYEMEWHGVDWWENQVEQAFNPPRVQMPTPAPEETASIAETAPSVNRRSSRRIGTSASAEDIRTLISDAVRTAFDQHQNTTPIPWFTPSLDGTSSSHAPMDRVKRQRTDPVGLRSRTKSVIERLLAPFKLGRLAKPSEVAKRSRRMSTGGFGKRPAITPDMAIPGREVLGRPVLSHANSLRPGHNPALVRAGLVNGQGQRTRPPNPVRSRRPSSLSVIGSPLETCEEEGLEEGRSPEGHIEMDAYEPQVYASRAGSADTGLAGVEDDVRVARAEQLRQAHDELEAQRAADIRRAGYSGRGDRMPRQDREPSRRGRGGGRGRGRGTPIRRGSWT
ncbi:hypothetical protein CB0940_10503 [Cercospora beticola]|uniref:Uncharacterized protein n=1 Tax=Cercospora beticola TaxID=122368 RepID=A0A2G5HUI4_CERBT|nr:hypothetical protein CB0940_10503 [Cercospora beticola]PIA96196.1 hypothetical protein CB0940_10503 [Cercospora beticola]WPB07223.1 hypothetical protein RHO25_011884 [Cercospora beticola]CAK1367191.1 unnamed protein product [Cercospora beticola]